MLFCVSLCVIVFAGRLLCIEFKDQEDADRTAMRGASSAKTAPDATGEVICEISIAHEPKAL